MSHSLFRTSLIGCLLAVSLLMGSASAQTAPEIEYLFPAGAQRGTRVEVLLGGKFMPGPCGLVVTGVGTASDNSTVTDRFAVTVAPDAQLRPAEVRIIAAQGGSPPFPFLIGDLPEIIHTQSEEVRELKLPVTINGRFHPAGEIHQFTLDLNAGQQIVCAATTRAIRSPLDATLRLLDPAGQVVASSTPQRSADSLLVFRASQPGRFTLQVFDFQLVRSPQHIYRLTVTDGPWLDRTFPAGVQENGERDVTLYGWNLPGGDGRSMPHRLQVGAAETHELTLPNCANRLSLIVGPNPESIEVEPNDIGEQAPQITPPLTVNGRLGTPGDIDAYAFNANKGARFAIEVASTALGFPADPALSVQDAAGKTLIELDDGPNSRDPSLRFTAPADGRFVVVLREHSRQGGDEFIYRLRIVPLQPDFAARVDVSAFALQSGQTLKLPVKVERIDGLEADLEVTAVDLPSGITVQPQPVPKSATATVQLPLIAAAKLGSVSGLVRIIVRTTDPQHPRQKAALIAENPQATSGSQSLWIAISPEVPFTLKTTATILEAPRLAAFSFPVTVERKAGFTGAIRLVGVEPDRRGTVVPLEGNIAAESPQGTIPLIIQHGVTEGTTHRCRVMGVAEVLDAAGKPCLVFHVAGGSMSMGCQPSQLTLTAEPAVVMGRLGVPVQIRVQLMRRAAMEPVTLRIEQPAGVPPLNSDPVTVNADQSTATLTLNFARDAIIPPRTNLTIQAESSRGGLPIYGRATFRLEKP
ncbi:MAG: putative pre-peptidase [Planctomycetaceae bacterium]|nr:putative pre-peptidase [Planctomycetaceae bacterium]